jgi:molybdenum cofactor cytidylyltransferase
MNPVEGVAGIVLAAGSGRRFTAAGGAGPKLLAAVDGQPLLVHAVDAALAAGLRPVVVVLPPSAPELHAAVGGRTGVELVVNAAASEGLATSVVAGLRGLADLQPEQGDAAMKASVEAVAEAVVILLGDQPAIDPAVLAQVIAAWRRTRGPVRVRYDDGPGHPVLLPRDLWPAIEARLTGLDGDGRERGAGSLLAELDVIEVRIAGPAPVDVDVPADLGRVTGPHRGAPDER